MNSDDIDLQKLTDYIFDNNCKEPGSIQLTVEDDKNIRDVFEMLLILFTEGMKKKFGKYDKKNIMTVNLESLSEKDFAHFNRYFNSIGFNCFYSAVSHQDYWYNELFPDKFNINDDNIDNIINSYTKLSQIKYTIKCDNLIYSIYFDFILPN